MTAGDVSAKGEKSTMSDILIADDDRAAADALRVRLSRSGYECTVATNGQDAIEQFDRLSPRLVLLDASMPDLSGMEVCQQIRASETGHDTKIYFVSGATSPSVDYVRRCAVLAGADGFIPKPYDSKTLVELVDQNLGALEGAI